MRNRNFLLRSAVFTALLVFASAHVAFAATIPQAASAMGREMDRQMVERLGQGESPAQGVAMFVTTPVNVNNLEESNPLARQMQEELSRWFVQAGYDVQEIRQGANLLFEPETGELLLTRDNGLLGSEGADGPSVLTGTYVVTGRNVRFNIRLVHLSTRRVLAMSTMTVPINSETASMLVTPGKGIGSGAIIQPSVITALP